LASDLARCGPGKIALENVPHYCGFCLHNLELAAAARDRSVAVCFAARVPTVADHTCHPTLSVRYEIVQEERTHQTLQASVQFGDMAVGTSVHLDS